ncbi:MAG: hypothetical protein ACREIV_04115 [Planctomycetaceae bacterium]
MKTVRGLALAILAVWTGGTAAAAEAVYSSKTRFRIPYHSDTAEMQRMGAREIRLYLSPDRGRTWQHVQSVLPQAGRFHFEAAGDGEHWFAVRTLGQGGRLFPPGPITAPGLRVIVDTISPTLQVHLRETQAGQVELTWSVTDEHLKTDSLRLEYYDNAIGGWLPVNVTPHANGQTAWSVPDGGWIVVRGTVSDEAGNVGRDERRVEITPVRAPQPQPVVPSYREPIASGEQTADAPRIAAPPRMPEFGGGPIISPGVGRLVVDGPASRPTVLQDRYAAAAQPTPHAGRTRVVRSMEFEVGYTIDDVGPSGVSSVDLYITQNDGGKWYHYGADPDRTSPFQVVVPRDGEYGFALRVKSGAGFAADPPLPGDKPDIAVAVDQTPPDVELLPPQQGQGVQLNRLAIQWRARDSHIAEAPVMLSYAGSPHGPWRPITGWMANTGHYVWTIVPGVPPTLYLQLSVRDAAGNVAVATTPQPMLIDLSRPSARIVDIQPAQDTTGPYR